MKVSILTLTFLLFLTACGKNNESGKTGLQNSSPYSTAEETLIRQDFYKTGNELLRTYEVPMKRILGLRTVGLIRNKLKYENVLVTTRYLYDDTHRYARSYHRDNYIELYIGRDQSDLDWGRTRVASNFKRMVMHELILMGNADDTNYFYTDKILIPVH